MAHVLKDAFDWLRPLRNAGEVLVWILRDPASPPKWRIALYGLGIVAAQYSQAAIIVLLALVFMERDMSGAFKVVTDILPLDVLRSHHMAVPFLLSGLFAAQAVLSFVCRRGLVRAAMDYYRSNMLRALNYYRAGLNGTLPDASPLLGNAMLVSFCLREGRYVSGAFMSLSATMTSLISLCIGLAITLYLEWRLTLLLLAIIIVAGLLQADILRRGVSLSRDILEGSADLSRDLREYVLRFSVAPRHGMVPESSVVAGLDLAGTQRFLNGYQGRLELGYASQLLAQISFAVVLAVAVGVLTARLDAGTMSSAQLTHYCVFLLPMFGALITLLNAVVGVTSARPYFDSYLTLFPTPEVQGRYHHSHDPSTRLAPEPTVGAAAADPAKAGGAKGWSYVLAPADELHWSEFIRLWPALRASGVIASATPMSSVVLMPPSWPKRLGDLDGFLGLSSPIDFAPLVGRFPKLANLMAEAKEAYDSFKAAAGEDRQNGALSSMLTQRQQVLIFLAATAQEGTTLLMTMRTFCSLPESERKLIAAEAKELSVLCYIPRVSPFNYLPRLPRAVAIFGDGSFADVPSDRLSTPPPEVAHRLATETLVLSAIASQDDLLS